MARRASKWNWNWRTSNYRFSEKTRVHGYPSALVLTVISSSEIQLSWVLGTTDHDGHSIERSTDGALFTEVATVTGSTILYNNTGLTADTLYYYRVRAYGGNSYSDYSNTTSDTTDA